MLLPIAFAWILGLLYASATKTDLTADEVAELSLSLQAKLLRALQERSFYRVGGTTEVRSRFRLISATHRDLEAMVTNIMPSIHMAPFNFEVWLINLTGSMLVLFALTPLVRARSPLMVPASFLFAAFLTANASLHIVMAITRERFVTGSITAPLLLAAGLFLFISTARHSLSALPKQG